jgi:hypothetical protein
MLRGWKPEQENGSRQAGLSTQHSHFSWIRDCIWSDRFVSSSDGVRGGSPGHHDAHANDAARRSGEVWYRAASGTASGASGTTTGTTHGTRRAASGAADGTRGATERAPRHHHRAEKVVDPFGIPTATGPRQAADGTAPPVPGHRTPCRPRQRTREAGCATRTPSRGLSAP